MSTSTNPLPHDAHRNTDRPRTGSPASKQQAALSESEAPCSSLLTSKSARTCSGICKNGDRCRARASNGYDFCAFHRPDQDESFKAGRLAGGRTTRYRVRPFEEQTGEHLALRLDSRGGIQGSIDNVLRMLVFGGISPNHANAATRLIAAALRNLDHTPRDTEDHSFDQYLSSISNHVRIQTSMHNPKPKPPAPTEQELLALAASLTPLFEASNQ